MGQTKQVKVQNTEGEDILDKVIAKWAFYPPDKEITDRIRKLGETLSKNYRSKKRDKLFEAQKDHLFDEIEDLTKEEKEGFDKDLADPAWYKKVFGMVSKVMLHNRQPSSMSDDEFSSYFQRYVAEKIYDHLAMLTHSPHRKVFGDFSLRKEFTWAIAADLGLGLYRRKETDPAIKKEVEEVLQKLAADFEDWFIYQKDEVLEATFGTICSLEYCVDNIDRVMEYSTLLIVSTDVSEYGAARAEKLRKAWVSVREEFEHRGQPGLVETARFQKAVDAINLAAEETVEFETQAEEEEEFEFAETSYR